MAAAIESTSVLRTRWLSVLVLFLSGLGAAMQFAKVPPALAMLSSDLGLGPIAAGFAISVVGFVGVALGIAVGSIVSAVGARRALIAALAFGAAMGLAGAAATSGWFFMASRLFEGVSHLVVVVAAPGLMISVAQPRDRPVALALWSCFFSVGFAIASAAAPFLLARIGWRGAFAVHGGLLALLAVLVLFLVARDSKTLSRPRLADIVSTHGTVYASGPPILLALVFGCYTIQFLAFLTFLSRHFIEIDGYSAAQAGALVSVLALFNPLVSLSTGPMVKRGADPVLGFLIGFVLVAAAAVPMFLGWTTPVLSVACAVVMMAALGALPGLAFTLLPRIARDAPAAARATGAIAQFGNMGTFAGPPLLAALVTGLGWVGGAVFAIMTSTAGILLAFSLRRVMLNRM